MPNKAVTLENNLVVELNDKKMKATILRSPNARGDLEIPRTIEDDEKEYMVTELGEYAFFGNGHVTSISFPEDSEVRVFKRFSLSCFIRKLGIPKKLDNFDNQIFENTVYLTEIELSPENPNFIFINGMLLTSDMKKLIFATRDVERAVIPNTIISICDYAFEKATSLKSIDFIDVSQVKSIGRSSFRYCSSLKAVFLPASVRVLNESCFLGCNQLEEVIFEGRIEKIDTSCFFSCYSLFKATILNARSRKKIIEISHHAFDKINKNFKLYLKQGTKVGGKGAPKDIEYLPRTEEDEEEEEEEELKEKIDQLNSEISKEQNPCEVPANEEEQNDNLNRKESEGAQLITINSLNPESLNNDENDSRNENEE